MPCIFLMTTEIIEEDLSDEEISDIVQMLEEDRAILEILR